MPRRRNPLHDAQQRVRDLANKNHAYESEVVLPLRAELAQVRADLKKTTERLAHLERLEAAYRRAWEAQVHLAAAQLASGKDTTTREPS